jgi:DnaJ-class molecular chaperone
LNVLAVCHLPGCVGLAVRTSLYCAVHNKSTQGLCRECEGRGLRIVPNIICPHCGGTGIRDQEQTLTAGVEEC